VGRQRVADAAQDGELVGALGELGQVLGDHHAVGVRLDGLEFTAVRVGRVGLQVEGVHVAGAAAEAHEDGGPALGGADGRLAAQGKIIAEAQAEAGERANAQEVTAGDSVTGDVGGHSLF
jgi:hypothetical protein